MNNAIGRSSTDCLTNFLHAPVRHANMKKIVLINRGKVRHHYSVARHNIQVINLEQRTLAKCFLQKLVRSERLIEWNNKTQEKITRSRHQPSFLTATLHTKHKLEGRKEAWASPAHLNECKNTPSRTHSVNNQILEETWKTHFNKNDTATVNLTGLTLDDKEKKKQDKVNNNRKSKLKSKVENINSATETAKLKLLENEAKEGNQRRAHSTETIRKKNKSKFENQCFNSRTSQEYRSKSRDSIQSTIQDFGASCKTISASYQMIKRHWRHNIYTVSQQNYLKEMEKKLTEVQYLRNKEE